MEIELDLSVSLKIDLPEGMIINPCDLISSSGDLSVELGGWSGLTLITFFNTKQGDFDHVYIVGDDLDIEDIRPQLMQYVNDNHPKITNIEVEMYDDYYQLVGKSIEELKVEITEALAQENWKKVAELATRLI